METVVSGLSDYRLILQGQDTHARTGVRAMAHK